MAYTIIGNPAVDRADSDPAGYTLIDETVVATSRGILKEASVYSSGTGAAFKIKIFRDDGTNYIFIGESPAVTSFIGVVTIPCWIPVEKGDLIGLYNDAGANDKGTSGGSRAYKAGDITTPSAKNTWTVDTQLESFGGKVFSRVAPILVRSRIA